MSENIGTIQLIAALRRGPLGARRLAQAVGRSRPVVVTLLDERGVVGELEDRCERLEKHRHPTLGRCRAVIRFQGGLALVEDIVDGVPISTLIERGPVPASVAVALMRRVFRALHIVWNREGTSPPRPGLIHGDLTPDHVWVEPSSRVKVLGLGTIPTQSRRIDPYRPSEPGWSPYSAPEAHGEQDGHAGDVYGAGCLLGALLTGRDPGHASEEQVWHASVVRTMMRRLEAEDIDAGLIGLIRDCMSFEPDDRPTAEQAGASLEDMKSSILGPRKEQWCEEFLPGWIRISRGDQDTTEGTTSDFVREEEEENVEPESDEFGKRPEFRSSRPPRPPPLVTPDQAPSYDDIQVDPETGEVSWGDDPIPDEAPDPHGLARSSERTMEMIPPHWVLEDEDDETDEAPFPFGAVELPSISESRKTTSPASETRTPDVSNPEELDAEHEETTATEPRLFDPDAANIQVDSLDELEDWRPSKKSYTPLVTGVLVFLVVMIAVIRPFQDESSDSSDANPTLSSEVTDDDSEPSRIEDRSENEPEVAVHEAEDLSSASVNTDPTPAMAPRSPPVVPDSSEVATNDDQNERSGPIAESTNAPVSSAPRATLVDEEANRPIVQDEVVDSGPVVVPDSSEPDGATESAALLGTIVFDFQGEASVRLDDSGLGELRNGQEVELVPGTYVVSTLVRSSESDFRLDLTADQTVRFICRYAAGRCECEPSYACHRL